MKFTKKEKTRLIILFSITILLVVTFVSSTKDALIEIQSNVDSIDELQLAYEELILEESSLKSEVTKLMDEDYIVRYGKEKYFYTEENEIIIRFE